MDGQTDHSTNQPTDRPTDRPTDQPMDRPTNIKSVLLRCFPTPKSNGIKTRAQMAFTYAMLAYVVCTLKKDAMSMQDGSRECPIIVHSLSTWLYISIWPKMIQNVK